MKNICLLLLFACTACLFSCSSDDDDNTTGSLSEADLIGEWILEVIRPEGADCEFRFGPGVPESYPADEEGCARPTEIQGNSKRCVNLNLMSGGVGLFLWSEISGNLDADINWTIENDEFSYCFVGSACSGEFKLVNGKLESEVELTLDDDCSAIYVLKRK